MPDKLFLSLALSLGWTLVLELPFAFALGVRSRRGLVLVALVNLLTNPPVALMGLLFSHPLVHLTLEAVAVLAEGWIYARCAPDLRRPYLFSLGANAFSYLTGAVLQRLLF